MTGKIMIQGQELAIKNFKLSNMCEHPSIVMIAKRGSGKSWVIRNIMKYFHKTGIPGGIVISRTDKLNPFYSHFFPDLFIHYEYKSSIIESLLYRQVEIKEKKERKAKEKKKVDSRCFLVMDDVLHDAKSWKKDKPMLDILMNGRHMDITFILAMQYPIGIGPELRSNFDYVFLLAEDIISNQKRIHEQYAGIFPDLASFRDVFTQMTQDFGCMVLANRGARHSFTDKVFKYKAEDDKDNRLIGCRQFVKFHKLNYDENWNKKKITMATIEDFARKRKKTGEGIKINIEN